jgi:predicted RNA-binding Zn-ribbon protein involved in translation (DUF1610 family)
MLRVEMTTIRTTCPRCGEVDMGPEAISLSVHGNGRDGSYRFTCPNCEDDVEKRADRKIVALLVSAGVDVEASGSTRSMLGTLFGDDPGPAFEGPPFTVDDVIEFHYLLQDDAYIRAFFANSGGA